MVILVCSEQGTFFAAVISLCLEIGGQPSLQSLEAKASLWKQALDFPPPSLVANEHYVIAELILASPPLSLTTHHCCHGCSLWIVWFQFNSF